VGSGKGVPSSGQADPQEHTKDPGVRDAIEQDIHVLCVVLPRAMNPFVECPTTPLRTEPPTASTARGPATTSPAQLVDENASTIRKTSGKTYKCGICGQPKQGHICPGKGVVKSSGKVVGVGADMQGHKQQMCEQYLARRRSAHHWLT
jgi:hypothetical protein